MAGIRPWRLKITWPSANEHEVCILRFEVPRREGVEDRPNFKSGGSDEYSLVSLLYSNSSIVVFG